MTSRERVGTAVERKTPDRVFPDVPTENIEALLEAYRDLR